MGTKFLNWNLWRLNAYDKQIAVRELIALHRSAIFTIQETKMLNMSPLFVRQLWFDSDFGWDFIPSQGSNGNSGSLLTIWDTAFFELLDTKKGNNSISLLLRCKTSGFSFVITNVYSPCDYNLKEEF